MCKLSAEGVPHARYCINVTVVSCIEYYRSNVSYCCVCCFTFMAFLVTQTCVLHLLICAATKWKKSPCKKKKRWKDLKENCSCCDVSILDWKKNREEKFCRLCRGRYISELVACFDVVFVMLLLRRNTVLISIKI